MLPRRSTVITLGTEYFLDRSPDGGRTWKDTYADTGGAPWNYLAYPSQTTGWAEAGARPRNWLRKSTDTGRSWHKIAF